MSSNFYNVMPHVFKWEGGYVDHPRDPGGATNMGITIHTARALDLDLDNDGDIDKDDIRLITKEVATEVYRSMYWDAVQGDWAPEGLDLVLMDAAVNSGPRASIRWLQRALGVTPDGALGPITRRAVEAANDLSGLIEKTIEERRKSVRQFRNFDVFGKGWMNRINNTEKAALEMSRG